MSFNKNNSIALIVVLTIICAGAGLALAFTYKHCREMIFEQIKQIEISARSKALPGAAEFKKVQGRMMEYFVAYDDAGETIGYTFKGSAKGYSSEIKVVIGVDSTTDTVIGISVTSQQETPGLGANMEAVKTEGTLWSAIGSIFIGNSGSQEPAEPFFQAQFRKKPLENLKVVKTKDTPYIEAMTGATISSWAVTAAVRNAGANFRNSELGKTEAVTGATLISEKKPLSSKPTAKNSPPTGGK